MDTGPTLKHKVTVKLNYNRASPSPRPASRNNITKIPSRPASPVKSTYGATSPEPTFRPKAKVNSSATSRKATASSAGSTVGSSTPRAGSPTKFTTGVRNGITSPTPTHKPKVPSNGGLRSPPVITAPGTPELRTRSLTTTVNTPSSLSPTDDSRTRAGSVSSLHHAVSFSSFNPPAAASSLSVSTRPGSASVNSSPRGMPLRNVNGPIDRENTSSPTLRIRSKVSKLAKPSESPLPSPTASTSPPLHPSTLSGHGRTRVSSISSSLSQQQAQAQQTNGTQSQFYPITTATPAANPHRFASTRPPPSRTSPPANRIFPSFGQKASPSDVSDVGSTLSRPRMARVASGGVRAKVDPASIPLPPQSPPASAVSFSSRSSVSRSSASVSHVGTSGGETHRTSGGSSRLSPATQQGPSVSMDNLKSTLDNLLQYTSGLPAGDESGGDSGHDLDTDGEMENGEDHKVKATAKSNRKIADLEITNRSLLAINATLEATKHRQAKEIRELRRKLRESRLILPPRAFRAVKSSLGPAEIADDEEDDEEEEEEEGDVMKAEDGDKIYQRIKLILDGLLKSGQEALERDIKDFPEGGKGTAKVLTAEELRDWHGTENDEHIHDQYNDTDHDREYNEHEQDEYLMAPDLDVGNQTTISEDEVEAMMVSFSYSAPTSPPPPILITQPT